MKSLAALLAIIFCSNFAFSQEWTTVELTDFAQVDFPVPPDRTPNGEETVFTAEGSTGIYIINVRNLSSRNIQLKTGELPQLYQGVVDGGLAASGGQLMEKRDIQTDGVEGIEILVFANANPQLPELRYSRIFFINQHLITVGFWTTESLIDQATFSKNRFFDSIKLKSKEEQSVKKTGNEETEKSPAYEAGYTVGYTIGKLLVPIGFILLIIIIVILISRKGKKKD